MHIWKKTVNLYFWIIRLTLKRHKLQLQIYAEALEKLTGKKVKERLIYSFNLGKVINT